MKLLKNRLILTLSSLIPSLGIASELEDAVTYGELLSQAVKTKQEVKLKKLPEYEAIKQYLSENECSEFKYKAYIVGPEQQQFLYLVASKRKHVIIGRHFKAPIHDGAVDVKAFTRSTKTCLDLGKPTPNQVALFTTHLQPFPNEFHVLQAQLVALPLFVGTSEDLVYRIEDGKISVLDKDKLSNEAAN